MDLRIGAAVVAARLAGSLSRTLGRGGGTALPGLVAERVAPELLAGLAAQLPQGAVVVTGTNGKTTTSHMLAAILRPAGMAPLRNASGSNLARGIVTALAARATPLGTLAVPANTVGIFETDEAAFGGVVPAVHPRVVAVTNLFRDQLDRYGEVDTVAAIWRDALRRVPGTALILNADDPAVANLAAPPASDAACARYFGIDDVHWGKPGPEHASDVKVCPQCGARLEYPVCFYGHIGHYRCPNGHRRPTPQVSATELEPRGFAGTDFTLTTSAGSVRVHLPLPGLYNVYNALAAAGAALELDASLDAVRQGLEGFTAAFGRLERVRTGDKTVYLVLAKNPVGMNEALRTLFMDGEPKHLLVALNDLDADGRDVSWIWDADFEHVAGNAESLVVSGRRADDLAVRLKYAGALERKDEGPRTEDGEGAAGRIAWSTRPDLGEALDASLANVPPAGTLYAVLTYTAMLALRRVLTERGHLRAYWEDE